MLALQRLVDGGAGHVLFDPTGHLRTMFFQAGDGGAGALGWLQGGRHGLVVGQQRLGIQPAMRLGQRSPLGSLAPPHDLGVGDISIGVALTHAQQGLSVVMHLESPAGHPLSPGKKPTG